MTEYDVSFTVRGTVRLAASGGHLAERALETAVRDMLADPKAHDALGETGAVMVSDLVVRNIATWRTEVR